MAEGMSFNRLRCLGLAPLAIVPLALARIGRREDYRRGDERDYAPWDEPRSTWKKAFSSLPLTAAGIILVLNIIMFILVSIYRPLYPVLALNPAFILDRPWTIVTHMFVHADMAHLIFNMIALFFFGLELERRVGERTFLEIYFLSGLVAAAAQGLVAEGYMVGASGALYGVMGCLAIIAPEIRVLLYFVIPVGIRLLVLIYAFIDFTMLSTGAEDNIAHMAHIAGLFVGLGFGMSMGRRPRHYYSG